MRVLFVSNHFPTDLSTSTQGIFKRMRLFIDALNPIAQLEMLFFVPPETDVSAEAIAATEQALSQHWQISVTLYLCSTLPDQPSQPKWRQQGEGIFNFFSQTDFRASPQQIQALEACLTRQPDAVFVHRLSNMSVAMRVRQPLPPIFFDLDDIEHIKFIRQIRQPPTRLQTLLYYLQVPARLRGELQAIRLAERTFVCSEHDRRYLSDRWKLPGVVSVPNAIQIPEPQPLTSEPTLLLLGGYYYFPNINAANFLIEQVWTHVHQAMPQARLLIAGPQPENIRSYGKGVPGVEFIGFVDDLDALYQRSRVVCCPILSGGGTRVKMIEAAAYGKSIVSTRIGAEGLEMTDGRDFLLRDRPQDFAAACIELLQNDTLCHSLGTAARSAAIRHYDRSNIVRQIQQQFQSHVQAQAPLSHPVIPMPTLSDSSLPLVSVVIPTYNRPDFLKAAIASVLQQTYQNFEIIVSDDCSAENPQPIVAAFQDSRIQFRRNPQNLGVGLNATYAFQAATGKYVASLNDDDLWQPDFLEKLVLPLEANPNLVLAFCDHYSTDATGTIDVVETEAQTKRWKRDRLQAGVYPSFWKIGLVDQSVYTASAAVMRREAIEWDRLFEAGVFWDYYIVYLACKSGGGAYYCPERLALYRVHTQSETVMSGKGRDVQAKIRKGKAAVFCHHSFMQDENLREFHDYFKQQWAHASTTLGIGFLRANQPETARPYLFQAWRSQPFNVRTAAACVLSFMPRSLTPFSRSLSA